MEQRTEHKETFLGFCPFCKKETRQEIIDMSVVNYNEYDLYSDKRHVIESKCLTCRKIIIEKGSYQKREGRVTEDYTNIYLKENE